MSIENPFNNPTPPQEETPKLEKVEEVKNPQDVFLGALNEELTAMEQSGRLTPEQAEEKRQAAALIETGFSDDPKHDALIFSRAGIAEEKELIGIFDKKNAERKLSVAKTLDEDSVERPELSPEEQKEESESQKEKRQEKQESKEGGESLKENDLIVSDDEVEPIKNILEKNKIPYKDREYTKRQVIDTKTGTAVPGEFVLTIFDPEHPDRPASFDFVKQVFKLIKDSNMVVRYGKNPERG